MAAVLIPVIFRGPTQGESRVSVPEQTTIGACFDAVEAQFPGLRALVIDPESGGIHRFVKLSLNGEVLDRSPGLLETAVGESDEIEVIAAIAGG
jgi:sulfur carrier protein ThiS